MNILVISRTRWSELPRIRHQLALLLQKKGHQVTFIEKCDSFGRKVRFYESNGIVIARHAELYHHQLKPFALLQRIYSYYAMRGIKKIYNLKPYDLVVNFNYDYSFLAKAFPSSKVITLINDDFEAQAKPWMKNAIKSQLAATCVDSDAVLTVSIPLLNKLKEYTNNVELFFPWCDELYQKPNVSHSRDIVIYFGFINNRIDWDIVHQLLKRDVKLRFVGPINESEAKVKLDQFTEYSNFEYLTARNFQELDLEDVCCSIAPYNINIESIKACTVSNRAFRLLSKGIPVIYPDLPYIIKAPKEVISAAKNVEDYIELINFYRSNFENCQPMIEAFLPEHSADVRYSQLLKTIDLATLPST